MEIKTASLVGKTERRACNRPDIVFENMWTMEGVIVELGICLRQSIQKTLSEKREKYVRLTVELSKLRRWQKLKIVPVVVNVSQCCVMRLV